MDSKLETSSINDSQVNDLCLLPFKIVLIFAVTSLTELNIDLKVDTFSLKSEADSDVVRSIPCVDAFLYVSTDVSLSKYKDCFDYSLKGW